MEIEFQMVMQLPNRLLAVYILMIYFMGKFKRNDFHFLLRFRVSVSMFLPTVLFQLKQASFSTPSEGVYLRLFVKEISSILYLYKSVLGKRCRTKKRRKEKEHLYTVLLGGGDQ